MQCLKLFDPCGRRQSREGDWRGPSAIYIYCFKESETKKKRLAWKDTGAISELLDSNSQLYKHSVASSLHQEVSTVLWTCLSKTCICRKDLKCVWLSVLLYGKHFQIPHLQTYARKCSSKSKLTLLLYSLEVLEIHFPSFRDEKPKSGLLPDMNVITEFTALRIRLYRFDWSDKLFSDMHMIYFVVTCHKMKQNSICMQNLLDQPSNSLHQSRQLYTAVIKFGCASRNDAWLRSSFCSPSLGTRWLLIVWVCFANTHLNVNLISWKGNDWEPFLR